MLFVKDWKFEVYTTKIWKIIGKIQNNPSAKVIVKFPYYKIDNNKHIF